MLEILPASTRGLTQIGWLNSAHSFSFGSYRDPRRMGFRGLRVINDDRVAPGGGFAPHGHRDMEILSYVVEGVLAHKDSLGNGSQIVPGDVQVMSAGTGITHSEFNGSRAQPVRFLQIWIPPAKAGLTPRYDQRNFPASQRQGRLVRVAGPKGEDDAVEIHQDVHLYAGLLAPGEGVDFTLAPGRHAWIQIVRGSVTVEGQTLSEGDGLAASDVRSLRIEGVSDAEILAFDLN